MRHVTSHSSWPGLAFETSTIALLIAALAFAVAVFGGDYLHGTSVDETIGIAFFFVFPAFTLIALLLSVVNLIRVRRFQFGVEALIALLLVWLLSTVR